MPSNGANVITIYSARKFFSVACIHNPIFDVEVRPCCILIYPRRPRIVRGASERKEAKLSSRDQNLRRFWEIDRVLLIRTSASNNRYRRLGQPESLDPSPLNLLFFPDHINFS